MHPHANLSHLARMLHEFYSVWCGSLRNTVRCKVTEAERTDHRHGRDLSKNRVT